MTRPSFLRGIASDLLVPGGLSLAQMVEVTPLSPAVLREGVTGAGWAVVADEGGERRVTLHYPNHPDDFGGSTGSGTSHSSDDGLTWSPGKDNWSVPDTIDLWQEVMGNGERIAFGIHWAPDPAKQRETTPPDVPPDAYSIAYSKDGQTWRRNISVIEFPAELGVIARPLPRIFEDGSGSLYMPAYAWGRSGNRSLLLKSEDGGLTWGPVAKVLAGPEGKIVVGKLPGLLRLPNGVLVLLTALSGKGCFLHLSPDGTGREWSRPHTVTPVSGGNTSMAILDANRLLVFTPANKRIHCWTVAVVP